ncbi:hypothetical protein F8568_002545 [Actinomadura sp. LD22]|uniref:ATP-binding protein n=1 Tax=Actinomadura physcomitrii TaxID=2650748 RepID=A0A6I4M4Q7_9ACTN|nr:hypothetical protein [Actinomadura physcomitrii]MVZ99283.1 hypothetical protein [Actinomadura physcomitrii]
MNRSARKLPGLSAASAVFAVSAVFAAPANAVQGPVADLVHGTAGQVGPALPPPAAAAPASAARTASAPGAASGLPAPVGQAAAVPGRVVGRVTSVPKRVVHSKVGKMGGAALPTGRSAASGASRASGSGPLGDAVALGRPGDAAALRSAAPISMVFPDGAGLRRGKPAPRGLAGEADGTVKTAHSQVGSVVNVLKTRERPSDTGRAPGGLTGGGLPTDGLTDKLSGPPVYLPKLPVGR